MTQLSDTIGARRFGEPVRFRNLTMFPLAGDPARQADYLTLDAMELEDARYNAGIGGARHFLDRVSAGVPSEYPAVGLGTDLRYHDGGLTVAALVWDDALVHLCAFALGGNGGGEAGVDFSRASARARRRGRSA